MTPDERARAAIGRALIDLYRETTAEPVPPGLAELLDRLAPTAPPPSPSPAPRRRFWRRPTC